MFLIAFKLKSDKLTDISYAVSFVAIIAVYLFDRAFDNSYPLILSWMVLVWSIRIGGFLLMRVMKKGKDSRFDGLRDSFKRFGRFWISQAITVWILMIPVLLTANYGGDISRLSMVGFGVWIIGLLIESVADAQKWSFSQNFNNKNKWIHTGIWKYSRHPNYFGEIVVWIGVYLFTYPALVGSDKLVGLASPIFITLLLLFASGVPVLEKSADKRWGDLPEYRHYKKRTSLLIPLPPRK
jgi:steroid 5-alpha reductase family enzyme